MSNALTIAKFGGTSVANYAAMQNCAKIVAGNPARAVKTLEKPKTKYYQL